MNNLKFNGLADVDQGQWIHKLLQLRKISRALGPRKEPVESQEELYSRTAMEMRAQSVQQLSTSFDS